MYFEGIPKVEKEPDDQIVNQDETLKVKIPIIGKGPFTLHVRKDGEDIPASSYRISELDGTVVFTIPSKETKQRLITKKFDLI